MAEKEFSSSDYFACIDEHCELYKKRLSEAVSIPSVSADLPKYGASILKMMEWTKLHIERLGGKVELYPNPVNCNILPPILLGEFIFDPKLKTVCVYGHLDVQPAAKADGWHTDPFTLTEIDGKLFGRGSTDDKGPALSWLWLIEAHQELGMKIPVNIKMIFEGLEESGSEGMYECIQSLSKKDKFLYDVDFFCISDNYWLGKNKPCVTYGLRGMAYFQLEVKMCEQDLHSGVLGGTVHEAMTDLIKLMSTLVDNRGRILVDGVMDDVRPVSKEEEALYDDIDFSLEDYKEESTVRTVSNALIHKDKTSLLMARWRFPTLSLHGIEGAFSGSGAKTVIPSKVIGKFSLRLVPDQNPKRIDQVVTKHLETEFAKLESPNKMKVTSLHSAKAWLSSTNHPNYKAAAEAIKQVYGQYPDFTREGGSIPITSYLEDATGMNVLLLPVGACDDMAHSQNEKFNVSNMLNAIKVLGIYLHEIAKLKGPKPSECKCEPLTDEELMVPGAFMKGFRCKCEL